MIITTVAAAAAAAAAVLVVVPVLDFFNLQVKIIVQPTVKSKSVLKQNV